MNPEELLLNLQDIQSPPEPGWWLLPPFVWYLLFAAVCGAIALWAYRRYRDRQRLTDLAARELLQIESAYTAHRDTRRLALDLSRWLRQVAIQAYPDARVGALTGSDWLAFLDQSAGMSQFCGGAGQVFSKAVFQPRNDIDADATIALCRHWLQRIRVPSHRPERVPC